VAVYTPEEGISIDMLAADISHLKQMFARDSGQARAGRLILVNEKASSVYSAKLIADMIRQEAHERFESRDSIPGHVQQGGVPSPMDRTRAVRLAIKCMEHLEAFAGLSSDEIYANPKATSVIGIRGASVVFTDMVTVETTETDWKARRPKQAFWEPLRHIVDTLSGRPDVPRPEKSLTGHAAKDAKRGI
jgi:6-phosphofructokinase 1